MKKLSGSAVARHQIFTLADGSFVVRWDENQVQELMTGSYRIFDPSKDYGHAITDYELRQLKAAGCVEHFTRHFVWLYALPERGRLRARTMGNDRQRAYYLSTALSQTHLGQVERFLQQMQLDSDFFARVREGFVVILGKNGGPFRDVRDAEIALKKLQNKAPNLFQGLSIAFIETKILNPYQAQDTNGMSLSLDDIIASQGDVSVTEGKTVVLALNQHDEREAFIQLLAHDMKLTVHDAPSGQEAVYLMEDYPVDLLVIDIQLPDMHGWELLGTLKERINLSQLPIVVIMDDQTVVPIKSITSIVRPVSMALLRHTIWMLLKESSNNNNLSE